MAQRFEDKAEELRASALLTDAKVRIAMYGDAHISRAVGRLFGDHGGDFSRKEDMQAFVNLICQMRHHVTGKVSDSDRVAISQILFSKVVED